MTEVRQREQEVTLLPCPFCGATDAFIDGAQAVASWVICGTCLSSAADCLTKSAAIEAWNRRTDDPAALLDALEALYMAALNLNSPSQDTARALLRKYGRLS